MMIHRLRSISLFLLLFLGVLGIGFGIFSQTYKVPIDPLTVTIVSTAGSALFGTSLTMLIDRMLGTELMDIKSYLFRNEKFESAPEYIEALKGRWHHYDMSEKDGVIFWQYLTFDYEKDSVSNTLKALIINVGHDGVEQKYDVTAGFRGGSLVATMRARDSAERDSIEIIPGILNSNLGAHLGVQVLETWDGNTAFTYSIMSRKKLISNDVLTAQDNEKLFEELKKLVKRHKINPIVSDASLSLG